MESIYLYIPISYCSNEHDSPPSGALLELTAETAARIAHLAEIAQAEGVESIAESIDFTCIEPQPDFITNDEDATVSNAQNRQAFEQLEENDDVVSDDVNQETLVVMQDGWFLRAYNTNSGAAFETPLQPIPTLPLDEHSLDAEPSATQQQAKP